MRYIKKAKDKAVDAMSSLMAYPIKWNNENKIRVKQVGERMKKYQGKVRYGSDEWKKLYNEESEKVKEERRY